jgi:hypothetical protein
MLQFPSSMENLILVAPNRVRHIRFAHRHLSPGLPPPIEVMGNGATARLGHEGFQANHFLSDPFWLGLNWMAPSCRTGYCDGERAGIVSTARIEGPLLYRGASASTETVPAFSPLPFGGRAFREHRTSVGVLPSPPLFHEQEGSWRP